MGTYSPGLVLLHNVPGNYSIQFSVTKQRAQAILVVAEGDVQPHWADLEHEVAQAMAALEFPERDIPIQHVNVLNGHRGNSELVMKPKMGFVPFDGHDHGVAEIDHDEPASPPKKRMPQRPFMEEEDAGKNDDSEEKSAFEIVEINNHLPAVFQFVHKVSCVMLLRGC